MYIWLYFLCVCTSVWYVFVFDFVVITSFIDKIFRENIRACLCILSDVSYHTFHAVFRAARIRLLASLSYADT